MTKREFQSKIESFDDKSILLFSDDINDFTDLDGSGISISNVVEVNTGTEKYIVLSE